MIPDFWWVIADRHRRLIYISSIKIQKSSLLHHQSNGLRNLPPQEDSPTLPSRRPCGPGALRLNSSAILYQSRRSCWSSAAMVTIRAVSRLGPTGISMLAARQVRGGGHEFAADVFRGLLPRRFVRLCLGALRSVFRHKSPIPSSASFVPCSIICDLLKIRSFILPGLCLATEWSAFRVHSRCH